jgi:hypothetical protein
MLFNTGELASDKPVEESANILVYKPKKNICIGTPVDQLKKHIGQICHDEIVNFWSFGRWSMHDLLIHLLKQTGPADVLVTTWSISESAVRDILKKHQEGIIKSIKFLIDPRIKVRNPKPLQLLAANFTYKFIACHAKVTTIENEDWHVSIVSSANMTNNPRFERGVIFPCREIFEFDKQTILNEFNN